MPASGSHPAPRPARTPVTAGRRGLKPVLLVALGGNAMVRKGQTGTVDQQFENLREPIGQIARLSRDYRVIITHGNGPQVGSLLLQQEQCSQAPRMPLEIIVAQTQGQIGYMIESTLDRELMSIGIEFQPLVSLISYVVVDEKDPAFTEPTKPIGPTLSAEVAAAAAYPTRKTARGFRRVVASPQPLTVVEKREIRRLIEMGFIVVCCGGGGIPVIREGRGFAGVDAVIDKDLVSARLAEEVGVDLMIIATDVDGVYMDYDSPRPRRLDRLTPDQAEALLRRGCFPPGSMGPKVTAAVRFARRPGRRAAIASTGMIAEAAAGRAGTQVAAEPPPRG